MFRSRRVPPSRDKFFQPLRGPFHWAHCTYCRLLVVTIACMWGRRNVAHLYRYLEAPYPRTRCNHVCLVARWDPAAPLRQQAQAWLCSLRLGQGETIDLVMDDSKQANRGKAMDAVAKGKDPTTQAYRRGHQQVCAILVVRDEVIPLGIRLYGKKAPAAALPLPCRKTTAWAAELLREGQAPAGVKVLVLFDAYSLGHTVVQAGREPHWHFASTRKSHRRLCTHGWKRKAGRDGRPLFRRRRTTPLVMAKPSGRVRCRCVDAGWRAGSNLGTRHVAFSRTGTVKTLRGLVPDTPAWSAAGLIQAQARRWDIAPWRKDAKPRLGRGQSQHRPSRAAVIHLHLVCFASALLTHLRLKRDGAPGQRTREKAADLSTATAPDQLRALIWKDLLPDLKENHHGQAVIEARERLRVA